MNHYSKTLLISSREQKICFQDNEEEAINIVIKALSKKKGHDFLLPEKTSIIFNEVKQNRINCMPAALLDDKIYGVKWVSVFPENPKCGLKNVAGNIILSETENGHTISVMDAGYLTELRTAAVGATAAYYLSRKDSSSIGFIGAGNQAKKHLDLIKKVRPNLRTCYVSSRSIETATRFIEEKKSLYPDMDFILCGNDYEKAVINADIIVTAISGQKDILKAHWIKKGVLYIHVAGWEDEYPVALKASKIICDDWEAVKHRTQTISRMYKEGILQDNDIYANLNEIVTCKKPGREDDNEFIYFCSVGLAFIDISFAKYIYDQCLSRKLGFWYQF
ncbi:MULTISPECIES: ornithine cyclodeaminase family protein [Erysipelotrichaceae]|uniref:ornithine cyclodeaminase family protein n=1 Tax=Erysipelotrichaceae TaxID=128827 RepID=UPI00259BBB11|nr:MULTISPECIES: ornithine cyclodeaminase family protein [Erysipelotrichaceae]